MMKHPNAMTEQARASDPFAAYFDTLRQDIIDGVVEHLKQTPGPSPLDLASLGLEPLRAYSAKEVAKLLGTARVASVYEIPEDELPRVRRIGSAVGFLGINVVAYMHGLAPVDVAAAVEQYRDRLMHDRPTVRALHTPTDGKTRIL